MRNISPHIQKLLLLFGNRIGLVLVVGITLALLLVENTEPVFSEQEIVNEFSPHMVEVRGLTFDPKVFPEIEFASIQTVPNSSPIQVVETPTPNPTSAPIETPLPDVDTEQTVTPTAPTPTAPDPTVTAEPTITPIPTEIPLPSPIPNDPNADAIWDQLAKCESGGNWQINTGNGYFGGLQFSQGAWNSAGGQGSPHEASREEQISRGKQLQASRGWGAWGLCAKKLNLN